ETCPMRANGAAHGVSRTWRLARVLETATGMRSVVFLLPLAACIDGQGFLCTADSECQLAGARGWCEAENVCSFDDSACASGRRYGEYAGTTAGECVAPAPPPPPPGDPLAPLSDTFDAAALAGWVVDAPSGTAATIALSGGRLVIQANQQMV